MVTERNILLNLVRPVLYDLTGPERDMVECDLGRLADVFARLREVERERDAARAEVADLIGRLRVANLNADDAARQRDAWREDARLRAINTDAARAEVARLTARVAEVEAAIEIEDGVPVAVNWSRLRAALLPGGGA